MRVYGTMEWDYTDCEGNKITLTLEYDAGRGFISAIYEGKHYSLNLNDIDKAEAYIDECLTMEQEDLKYGI